MARMGADEDMDICHKGLPVKDHAQAKGKWCDQDKYRENHPKPGPILDLPSILAHRNDLKKLRAEQRQKTADGIAPAR
mgnify:CR=1 FL=1